MRDDVQTRERRLHVALRCGSRTGWLLRRGGEDLEDRVRDRDVALMRE